MNARATARYEQLIVQELTGVISPKDKAALDKAKAKYPEVNKLWEENQRLLSETQVQQLMNEKIILPPVSTIPTIRKSSAPRMVALCIAVVILSSLFFWLSVQNPVAKVDANAIQLRLENGEIIDLSEAGDLQTDDISLKKLPGSLTYISNTSQSALLIVPAGKDYTVTLSDGTEVTLNAASSLRFPTSFNRDAREVIITGEAYFDVTRNANSPLTVKTTDGEVKVLGTAFNINSYEAGKLQVALITGKVLCKTTKDSSLLAPGFEATCTKTGIVVQEFKADLVLGWRKGTFQFNSTKMEDLVKVMERMFAQEIVLDGAHIGQVPLSGALNRNISLTENLNRLQGVAAFGYSIDANNVVHIK